MAAIAGTLPRWRQVPRLRVSPREVVRFLRSREAAILLLGLILVAVILGTLLPQKPLTPPREYDAWKAEYPQGAALAELLSLTQVYQSWWFLTLLGLLFASLMVCTVTRVGRIRKLDRVRHRAGRGVPAWVALPANHLEAPAVGDGEADLQRAAAALQAAGYSVKRDPSAGYVFAEKGRWGVWGSTVLHVSIMLMLLGGVYSGAGKMAGYVELAEGQAFTDAREGYLQLDAGPLGWGQFRNFQARLDGVKTDLWQNGQLRGMVSNLTLLNPQGVVSQSAVGVDRPLSYEGATIYQARRYGYAALLALEDASGNALAVGYVNFAMPRDYSQAATNRFSLPGTDLRAEADLRPGAGAGPYSVESWSQEKPSDTWLYLFLRDGAGAEVFQGPVRQGEAVEAGAYRVRFVRAARWAGFPVMRDPGLPVIFAGFALCALGALLLYLVVPKRVWVWVKDGTQGRVVCMGGRADKYQPAFNDELREMEAARSDKTLAERTGRGHA